MARYRKGVPVSKATEKELLRYQMERIVKKSDSDNLGECSKALAELYKSFKDTYTRRFFTFVIFFQFFINSFVFVKKLFWKEGGGKK